MDVREGHTLILCVEAFDEGLVPIQRGGDAISPDDAGDVLLVLQQRDTW